MASVAYLFTYLEISSSRKGHTKSEHWAIHTTAPHFTKPGNDFIPNYGTSSGLIRKGIGLLDFIFSLTITAKIIF